MNKKEENTSLWNTAINGISISYHFLKVQCPLQKRRLKDNKYRGLEGVDRSSVF